MEDLKIQLLSAAVDQLLEWCSATYIRLRGSSSSLLLILATCEKRELSHRPFKFPQRASTVLKYMRLWKHFLFYVIRTSSIDEGLRDKLYGIQYLPDQLRTIQELLLLSDELTLADVPPNPIFDEGPAHGTSSGDAGVDVGEMDSSDIEELLEERIGEGEQDEDDDDAIERDEVEGMDGSKSGLLDRSAVSIAMPHGSENQERSLKWTRFVEKVMQLSIAFITQYFPLGDDLHSPLVHFADVLGISIQTGRFNEPYSYTSHVAALLWTIRLLMMEYALPSHDYISLGWASHATYENIAERLKWVHDEYLTRGSFHPTSRLIQVLAFGKATINSTGRPPMTVWDTDYERLQVKDIWLRLRPFKDFVRDGITLTERVLKEELFFGHEPCRIDLNGVRDVMSNTDPSYSFLECCETSAVDGRKYMLDLMKRLDPSKTLIKDDGRWDLHRARAYLNAKKRFLKLLMVGNDPPSPQIIAKQTLEAY